MAGSISAFQNTLFLQPQALRFPNLNRATEDKVYSVAQKPQLGIEQKVAKGNADLKEISAFVRGVLADKSRLAKEVEGLSFDQRVYLHINLNQISSYIETHNKKVDANFLITLVHVILLVLTFGGFHYRDTLHIENFVSTLAELGATGNISITNGFDLPFVHLLSMSKEDRELVLERAGLLDKWNAFVGKYPKLLEKKPSVEVQSLLSPVTLEHLQKARSFEGTRLVLLLDKADFDKLSFLPICSMNKVDAEPILERAGLFHKWEAFMQEHPEILSTLSASHAASVASLSLGALQQVADFAKTPLIALCKPKGGEQDLVARFGEVDSSKLNHIDAKGNILFRENFTYLPGEWPLPTIGVSPFVSKAMVEHLMRDKKDMALGVKYCPGDAITNMEGALHTFVTPVCPISMTGDYQWVGRLQGKPFGNNHVRPVILSAAIHPDFERDNVMMPLVRLQERAIVGAPLSEEAIPSADQKKDPTFREGYEEKLLKHMVYHLSAAHKLPAISEIKQGQVMDLSAPKTISKG